MPDGIEVQPDAGIESAASLDIGVAVVLVAAIGLFALIARRLATRASDQFDHTVRNAMQDHRIGVLDIATTPITLLSMPLLVVSATAALVAWLKHEGRTEAAFAIGFTPLAAASVGQSFTSFFDQRNPPDKADAPPNGEGAEASFPSGHTTGVTAEALSIAYILTREQLATPAIVGSLVAWPLVVGVTRVYRDRHWASDILAGWTAGVGVAAVTALLYEWRRSAHVQPPATAALEA